MKNPPAPPHRSNHKGERVTFVARIPSGLMASFVAKVDGSSLVRNDAVIAALEAWTAADEAKPDKAPKPATGPASQSGRSLSPFIEGLLDELPDKGASWSAQERGAWLQAAAGIFGVLYKGDGEIVVAVQKTEMIS